MNSPVEKIKERLTIEDVVSSYIKLERTGENFKARCPFHNEKTPSFFVSPGRASYYCFGCGAKGDIFTFTEEFEGLDFKGALKLLANKAGVTLEAYSKEMKEAESEKDRLYLAMEEAANFFEENLKNNKEAGDYLKSRGLEEKTITDFRIGFIKDDWRLSYNHLKSKGFTDREIELAGLAKASEKGFYDRFRGRIMFPISDSSGRVVAFSGRIFGTAAENPDNAKYLNSPETPIFNKSSVFFGIDKAKESIRKNNFSILVEGQMDLVLSHQAGYRNTIATSGTALSESTVSKENAVSNLGLVRRLSENIVLAFDADKAGFNAANRAGKIALSLGMDVKVAAMPEGVDPADLISKNGVAEWKEAIKSSKHLIEFVLDKVLKDANGDLRKVGREVKEKILPYVAALPSSIEKAHFIKKISDLSGIPVNALEDDLKNIKDEAKSEEEDRNSGFKSNRFRKDYILDRVLGIIFWQQTLAEPVINADEILKDLPQGILEKFEDRKEDLIFEAEVFYGGDVDLKKDTEELLFNLREESLKEELSYKMRELNAAEEHKEPEKSAQILKEINEINSQIQNIKNSRIKSK